MLTWKPNLDKFGLKKLNFYNFLPKNWFFFTLTNQILANLDFETRKLKNFDLKNQIMTNFDFKN